MFEVAKPVKIPLQKGKSLGNEKSHTKRNWGILAGFLTPQAQGDKGNSWQPAIKQRICEAEPRVQRAFQLHCRIPVPHTYMTTCFCNTCAVMASSEELGLEDSASGRKVVLVLTVLQSGTLAVKKQWRKSRDCSDSTDRLIRSFNAITETTSSALDWFFPSSIFLFYID